MFYTRPNVIASIIKLRHFNFAKMFHSHLWTFPIKKSARKTKILAFSDDKCSFKNFARLSYVIVYISVARRLFLKRQQIKQTSAYIFVPFNATYNIASFI